MGCRAAPTSGDGREKKRFAWGVVRFICIIQRQHLLFLHVFSGTKRRYSRPHCVHDARPGPNTHRGPGDPNRYSCSSRHARAGHWRSYWDTSYTDIILPQTMMMMQHLLPGRQPRLHPLRPAPPRNHQVNGGGSRIEVGSSCCS